MQKLRATLRKRSSVQWISSPYLRRRKQSEKVLITSYSEAKCNKVDVKEECDVNQDETDTNAAGYTKEKSLSFDKNLVQEHVLSEPESPASSEGDSDTNFKVSYTSYRSKSFDFNATSKGTPKVTRGRSTGMFLDVPKWKLLIRKPSMITNTLTSSSPNNDEECTHCQLLLEFRKRQESLTSSSIGSDLDKDELENFKFTIYDDDDADDNEEEVEDDEGEYDSNSEAEKDSNYSNEEKGSSSREYLWDSIPTINEPSESDNDYGSGITMVSLVVPVNATKQTRSSSVDSSFLKVPPRTDIEVIEQAPSKSQRSRSVDIVLPEGPNGPYLVVPVSTKKITTTKKAIQGEIKISTEDGETRTLRSAPDWGETAINGDHLWVSTNASGDLCYVGENECSKQGPRLCCPTCKITAHTGCIGILFDKIKFHCKPTFKDVGVRQYREQTVIYHHWVHRRHQKGRCRQCSKSFQSKLSFGNKEIVAVSCSWCKTAYHNKESCFVIERLTENCALGIHRELIIPPSWIVKLPRKGSFKSSIRRSPKNKRSSSKRRSKQKDDHSTSSSNEHSHHQHNIHQLNPTTSDVKADGTISQHRSFAIKPIPSPDSKPLLVFINPKSGGNQGSKLMQKFQWLLNPRQVFDLSQGGPRSGLELYKKVPNLRILACGGDGTTGWVLSVLDELGFYPPPPVAVLPLGTGNDLARALGWGGGYTDEPVSKILLNIRDGDVIQLDRWNIHVERNTDLSLIEQLGDAGEGARDVLSLNVMNNYFSIGVDAHIALEFHEAREAHPERFNSRLRNKMFYGQAGGKDLLQRKWKDLCSYITLHCDGVDLTQRLKDLKVHSLLFLNIPSYGGGTRPWCSNSPLFEIPRTDDGLIEVIGLTTYQLPLLQAGGHGSCIAQCKTAKIITIRTIPMQIDGEPCRLLPSVISINLRNQANMVAKAKSHCQTTNIPAYEREIELQVRKLNLTDYETYHYDKEKLKEVALHLGKLTINPDLELDHVRNLIIQMVHKKCESQRKSLDNLNERNIIDSEVKRYRIERAFDLSSDWCFIDSCTAERFFRVDRAQEHLHYVVDICTDDLFLLDPADERGQEDPSATAVVSFVTAVETNPQPQTELEPYMSENNNTIILFKPSSEKSSDNSKASDSEVSDICRDDNSSLLNLKMSDEDGSKKEDGVEMFTSANEDSKASDENLVSTSQEIIDAVREGNLSKLKRLHHEGYSLLAIDDSGFNALHYAVNLGLEDIVQYLINQEPSLMDMRENCDGQTPLHKAAKRREQKICFILAAAGCSLSKVDYQGLTARQLAQMEGDEELAAYLEHFECYQNTVREKEKIV